MKYPGLTGREARLAELLALLLQQDGHVAAAPESVEALLEAAGRAVGTHSAARQQRTVQAPAWPAQLSTAAARRKLDEMGFDKVDPSEVEIELAWVLANGIRKRNRYFLWAPEDLGSWLPEGQRKTLTDQILAYVGNAADSGSLDLADALGAVLGVSMRGPAPGVADALDTTTGASDTDDGEAEPGPRG